MKIAIGHKIQRGPYGGGNAFVRILAEALIQAGHEVFFELNEPKLDFIIMTDPRSRSPNVAFAAGAILNYLQKNPLTIVIHRINECDERKGTKTMNFRLRLANYCADHTVFVGTWLNELDLVYKSASRDRTVILNGADMDIFHSKGNALWDGAEKLKVVTHHWAGNWMKGFDVYEKVDSMLDRDEWRNRIEFTYIGNLPRGFSFRNARYVESLSGRQLADELRAHHVYLTGSINEPGGNHQIEGGGCGLPILYRNSGCLPEYCEGFGIEFVESDVEPAIRSMLNLYFDYQARMIDFPHNSCRTSQNWLSLICELDSKREEIIACRRRSIRHEILNRVPW